MLPIHPTPTVELVIEQSIYLVRGRQVMLDSALAALYEVETKALNRAVKRNAERFPLDFMFQLTREEVLSTGDFLRRQSGASKPDPRGGRRYLPYAFTELGVAMLSSVLTSSRAVQMNIEIMRTFVRLRQAIVSHQELERRVYEVEVQQREHASIISTVVEEIQDLKLLPEPPKRRIGF